ncbi:concanavalin A-like lectin/glucanase domain-containing protein [Mycena filopes]|nr:concanavalin A-like lectin/glucanase domain-containing protein [Mycena filopes]
MPSLPLALLSLLCAFRLSAAADAYAPLHEYSGTTFFDKWDFYGDIDNSTWGNVTFLDAANATSSKLVDTNAAGNAIIKVDNTATIAPAPLVHRNSVRIQSQQAYPVGSVIVADFVHMPYGCSVWPSFWLLGTNLPWPNAGEIDIVEGINMYDKNQMSLHTPDGCTQAAGTNQVGKTLVSNCLDIAGTNNNGCVTEETKPASYGAAFAQAKGGVYAVQLDVSGIFMWFWSRADIPASIKASTSTSSMDLSDWGAPSAAYPASSCNITQFFQPQKMIIDITLCGAWAGVPSLFANTCPGSCINDNIIGPGSPTYDNAYFEVQYIRTYGNADVVAAANANANAGSSSSSNSSSSTSGSGNTTTTTDKGSNSTTGASGAISEGVPALGLALAGGLLASLLGF